MQIGATKVTDMIGRGSDCGHEISIRVIIVENDVTNVTIMCPPPLHTKRMSSVLSVIA